jgi:hypothetical protein
MLTHIGHHHPSSLRAVRVGAELLDELDVPPIEVGKAAGVVVAVASQRGVPIFFSGQIVPLMTGNLTSLAADANRDIGEESYGFGHA